MLESKSIEAVEDSEGDRVKRSRGGVEELISLVGVKGRAESS